MTAKVCPRCGTQYENLHSTTCPQCFAKLLTIDEATAEKLSAARAQVEQTPEFQAAKAADDEKFREQSFGACLGVALIFLATCVAVIVLLVHAGRRVGHAGHSPRAASLSTLLIGRGGHALPMLPVAAAPKEDVLPASVGLSPTVPMFTRASVDDAVNLPGTLTRIDHAVYADNAAGAGGSHPAATTDVYALPSGRPTSEQNVFRLGLTLAASAGSARRPLLFFDTQYWHYAVTGDREGRNEAFAQALLAQMSR